MEREERKPFLIFKGTVGSIDLGAASQDDLVDVLSQCSSSKSLWFKITFDIYGAQSSVHPREFLNARSMPKKKREKFLNDKAQELRYGENIKIIMVNPDRPDIDKNY